MLDCKIYELYESMCNANNWHLKVIPAFLGIVVFVILMYFVKKEHTNLAEVYTKEVGDKYDGEGNLDPIDGEEFWPANEHKINKMIFFRFWNTIQWCYFALLPIEWYIIKTQEGLRRLAILFLVILFTFLECLLVLKTNTDMEATLLVLLVLVLNIVGVIVCHCKCLNLYTKLVRWMHIEVSVALASIALFIILLSLKLKKPHWPLGVFAILV